MERKLYLVCRCRLIPALAVACYVAKVGTADDRYIQFPGRYKNGEYAYTVVIPAGLAGSKTRPPAPAHGFFIPLAQEAKIDVNAEYNALDYQSVSEASTGEIEWFMKQCGADPQVVSSPNKLGTLEAVRTVIHCENRKSGQNMVLDNVVALRQATTAPNVVAIVYSVNLITTRKRYSDDAKMYRQILRSFRLTEKKR